MTIEAPKYGIDAEVYVRESAGIGMLEVVFIDGIYMNPANTGWMYAFRTGRTRPAAPSIFGNAQNLAPRQPLYLSEDELITKCEAYTLAEAVARANYERIRDLRAALCPPDATTE